MKVRMSPSSRRAWIEIAAGHCSADTLQVALLAEGVDRNPFGTVLYIEGVGSPSSRRAWIEIQKRRIEMRDLKVALLAEGVDRNKAKSDKTFPKKRRPPRGGRG